MQKSLLKSRMENGKIRIPKEDQYEINGKRYFAFQSVTPRYGLILYNRDVPRDFNGPMYHLRDYASQARIKGRSKMNKEELVEALIDTFEFEE